MTSFPGNTWGGSVQEWFWVDGYPRGAVRGRASRAARGMLTKMVSWVFFLELSGPWQVLCQSEECSMQYTDRWGQGEGQQRLGVSLMTLKNLKRIKYVVPGGFFNFPREKFQTRAVKWSWRSLSKLAVLCCVQGSLDPDTHLGASYEQSYFQGTDPLFSSCPFL